MTEHLVERNRKGNKTAAEGILIEDSQVYWTFLTLGCWTRDVGDEDWNLISHISETVTHLLFYS